jgi:prophage regulatory protein
VFLLSEVIAVAQPSVRLLRSPEVQARVGLSSSTIRRLIARKEFPPPILISARCVVWSERSIDAWITARIRGAARAEHAEPEPASVSR